MLRVTLVSSKPVSNKQNKTKLRTKLLLNSCSATAICLSSPTHSHPAPCLYVWEKSRTARRAWVLSEIWVGPFQPHLPVSCEDRDVLCGPDCPHCDHMTRTDERRDKEGQSTLSWLSHHTVDCHMPRSKSHCCTLENAFHKIPPAATHFLQVLTPSQFTGQPILAIICSKRECFCRKPFHQGPHLPLELLTSHLSLKLVPRFS